jgi:RNA-directed DNA polymerase
MKGEGRGTIIRFSLRGKLIFFFFRRNQSMKTRAFNISKEAVWSAYKRVKANRGSAGVDEVSLKEFDKDLRNNLYKLWARMCSGSYMPPPVLLVEIPKKDGGVRPLGIPTVSDRIAQTVVKQALETDLDKLFHDDSYGYRPGKSAIDAVGKCRSRCWQYNWVVDLDIKGFFNNIPHDLLLKALERHTSVRWHLLYVKRWLSAPVQQKDGSLHTSEKGTPQGAVVSPLLANLFLHYCMDKWLTLKHPDCPFERYADDAVIHCRTEAEAKSLMESLSRRLEACGLELHPDKTKVVYCKDGKRKGDYQVKSFDFLGYGFQPRLCRSKTGKSFVSFTPAISKKSQKHILEKVRENKLLQQSQSDLASIAEELNPKLRGWINYYGKYRKSKLDQTLSLVDIRIARWACKKYKKLHGSIQMSLRWVGKVKKSMPSLFVHWRLKAA